MTRETNPANASDGNGLAVAGATEPSANVVVTGRPGSAATTVSPTCAGTATPAAESTQVFMFVIAARATESRCAESAAATMGVCASGRGGAT
jgi:hypothetical protein